MRVPFGAGLKSHRQVGVTAGVGGWRREDHYCFAGGVGGVAGFGAAAHVVELQLENHRIVTNPIEPRGVVGVWNASSDRYTAYVSSQSIHMTRDNTARALGVAPASVRFVAPDVGGGFGAKNFIYPEHVLILWAAKRVRRPVKWVASRSEVFLADHQARDHVAQAALALDADGQFLALSIKSAANVGAYMVSTGGVQTFQYVHLPGTVYRIPAIGLEVAWRTAPTRASWGTRLAYVAGRVVAAVGPLIRQHSYEVGPEFVERFLDADAEYGRFFLPGARGGHAMFDLAGLIRLRLENAGVLMIDDLGIDTYSDARCYSYRRSVHRGETDYGRHVHAIALERE